MRIEPTFLWDGNKQLLGELSVSTEGIEFHFHDFTNSRLKLFIPLNEIHQIEIFKLYDFSVHGLKIIDKNKKEDLFILSKPIDVKRKIEHLMTQKK